MFVTGIKSIDLYFGGAWDFVSTGPTSANPFDVYGGQPYNTCNLCDVNEYVALRRPPREPGAPAAQAVARRPRRQRRHLHGLPLAGPRRRRPGQHARHASTVRTPSNNGLEPRHAWALIPDLWVQILWQQVPLRGRGRDDPGARSATSPRRARTLNNPIDDPPVRPRHADRVPRGRGQARPAVRLRLGERRPVRGRRAARSRRDTGSSRSSTAPGRSRRSASTPTTASTSSSSATS